MSASFQITSGAPSITAEAGSRTITWSGATFGADWYVEIIIRVRGVTVGSKTVTSGTSTSVTYTSSSVYAAAQGQSLDGAVTITANNYRDSSPFTNYTAPSVGTGNITINARISNFSLTSPTTASPINMDLADPVNLIGTWTRPSTQFYGRVRLYVGNASGGASTSWTSVSNRFGFTTGVSYDVVSLGLTTAIVNAMSGASPKDIKVEVQTQFDDGSASYRDLSGVSGTRTVSSGVIKNFVVLSTVSSTVSMSVDLNQSMSVSLSIQNSSYSHNAHLEFLTSAGSWSTLATNAMSSGVSTTSFTLTQAMVNSIASNYTATTALTDKIRVRVQTYSANNQSGLLGESTKVGSATIINCAPSFTSSTVYVEDVGGIVRTLTGGTLHLTTLLQNRSTATVTYGNIQTLKYATPVSYAIGFGIPVVTSTGAGSAGTNGTTTVSGITQALSAAQLNFNSNQTVNITITDSRGLTATQQITFIILPYSPPNLRSVSFYRFGGYTTDVRIDFSYDIQSIIIGGVERNGRDADDAQRRIGTGGAWTDIAVAGATTASGRITYTQASIVVGTQGLGDVQTYFLRYRDDVSTTYVETASITVGKAIPSFQITETAAFVNGIKVLVEGQGGDYVTTTNNSSLNSDTRNTRGVTRLYRRDEDNDYSVQHNWTGAHWHLRGYVGDTFHAEVRVGYADSAGGGVIHSSGSSSGQYWVAFTDGTLIKYGTYSVAMAISTASGSSFIGPIQTVVYDATRPFVLLPAVSCVLTSGIRQAWHIYDSESTTAQFKFVGARTTSAASSTWTVSWMAIGRWA